MKHIAMHSPRVVEGALTALSDVLQSGWLGLGPVTDRFEQELSDCPEIGGHVVAVNSGTSALHLALLVSDIPQGTVVIVPANTFIATAAVVEHHGCTVLLADIDIRTGNIDPDDVASKLASCENISAVIAVHYTGIPCDVPELQEICQYYGAVLIEDCAHAIGTLRRGKPLASSGNIRAYSFHATKLLAIGEGGCLALPSAKQADRARIMRRLGIDRSMATPGRSYGIRQLGHKYNMGDVAAAIGISQLSGLAENLARRRQVIEQYCARLDDPKLSLVTSPSDADASGAFGFTILVDSDRRDQCRRYLNDAGIETEIYFTPLSRIGLSFEGFAPQALEFGDRAISLPVHASLTAEDVDYVSTQTLKSLYA